MLDVSYFFFDKRRVLFLFVKSLSIKFSNDFNDFLMLKEFGFSLQEISLNLSKSFNEFLMLNVFFFLLLFVRNLFVKFSKNFNHFLVLTDFDFYFRKSLLIFFQKIFNDSLMLNISAFVCIISIVLIKYSTKW